MGDTSAHRNSLVFFKKKGIFSGSFVAYFDSVCVGVVGLVGRPNVDGESQLAGPAPLVKGKVQVAPMSD